MTCYIWMRQMIFFILFQGAINMDIWLGLNGSGTCADSTFHTAWESKSLNLSWKPCQNKERHTDEGSPLQEWDRAHVRTKSLRVTQQICGWLIVIGFLATSEKMHRTSLDFILTASSRNATITWNFGLVWPCVSSVPKWMWGQRGKMNGPRNYMNYP